MVRFKVVACCLLFAFCCLSPFTSAAQEVLLPLQRASLNIPNTPNTPNSELRTPNSPHSPKSATQAITLPFFDDFADGTVSSVRWAEGSGATVSVDVSPLAPTVGVATLDALGADGRLYPQASSNLFPADTLLSLPIWLDSLTAGDSVVFSFHYLPGGGYGNMWERVGETPDAQDSLFLDFYRGADSMWVTVWSCGGISVDTLMARTGSAWQYVVVPIVEDAWFDSTFRFRFRNYASLEASPKAGKAGNGDYWHLDCVMLDRGRDAAAGPAMRDVAFAAPAPSMLRSYRAMPYRQYTPAAMKDHLAMTITNRYSSTLATHYTYTVVDDLIADTLYRYDGGFENASPFLPGGSYQTVPMHATPTVGFTFPAMTAETDYTVVHVVQEGTGGDAYPANDTVRFRQHFGDYYAYDDGSAENGYGLTSTASRLYLACRFDLAAPDTLTAVDLWFNDALDSDNTAISFYLTLWSVDDDGRPGEVLYRDEMRRHPQYRQEGGFVRYVLERPVTVEGALFVGFEQSGNDYINLGFDRSYNSSDRIWYLTSTEWQQSILSGSLMLRPAFGAAATVGTSELRTPNSELTIYPNPASDRVHIDGEVEWVELYDMQGRRRATSRGNDLDVSSLPDGMYFLRVTGIHHTPTTATLLIHH